MGAQPSMEMGEGDGDEEDNIFPIKGTSSFLVSRTFLDDSDEGRRQ